MADYKKLYLHLFNAVTDAEEQLSEIAAGLREAQQACEGLFMEQEEVPLHPFPQEPK